MWALLQFTFAIKADVNELRGSVLRKAHRRHIEGTYASTGCVSTALAATKPVWHIPVSPVNDVYRL